MIKTKTGKSKRENLELKLFIGLFIGLSIYPGETIFYANYNY